MSRNNAIKVRSLLTLAGAMGLRLFHPQRAVADDHVEGRYEFYKEEDHRMEVTTYAAELEKKLWSTAVAHARFVYDGVSGASPNGLPPPSGSNQVPLTELDDIRRAVNLDLSQQWGRNTLKPAFAYSGESDYISRGIAYTHSIDFNLKNTTLKFGASHDFDSVLDAGPKREWVPKNTTTALLGLSQLLSPKTILSVDLTGGYIDGYLSDPYKLVAFDAYDPSGQYGFHENRPGQRSLGAGLITLSHAFTKLEASLDASYRLYHDSWGIWGNTAALVWNQKLGSHVTLSPGVRFYQQTAADFYFVRVPAALGDPLIPLPGFPTYYSADYRISSLQSWTLGLNAVINITEHIWIEAAYKRYAMFRDNTETSVSAYPKANVFTAGLTIWF